MNPKTEKILLITGIFFLILALGSSVGYFFWSKMNEPQQIVGGDKDEHGCIGSAGYTWCEAKNKCLRIWEEKCTQENNNQENINKQYIIISSPTINDKWKIGQTYQIKWQPIDPNNNVNIFLMDKNITEESASKSWQVENISNTGEYSFTVPQLPIGNKYQFYISSKEINGYSNLFEISN